MGKLGETPVVEEEVEPYYPPVEGEDGDAELTDDELDEAQEQADATIEAEAK